MGTLEDDHYQEIKMSRADQSLTSDNLVRFYDEKKQTTYFVDVNTKSIAMESGKCYQEEIERSDVTEVLERLTLENGRFGPRGYQEWMSNKLRSRFPIENDIPGYAMLCEHCHRMLVHSSIFYKWVLRKSAEMGIARVYDSLPRREIFGHYKTTEALHASASAKCHFCSLVNGLDDGLDEDGQKCDGVFNATYHLEVQDCKSVVELRKYVNGQFQNSVQLTHCTSLGKEPEKPEEQSTLKYTSIKMPEVLHLA